MASRGLALSFAIFCLPLSAYAADLTGVWNAKFDTQIGPQDYTYELTQRAPS